MFYNVKSKKTTEEKVDSLLDILIRSPSAWYVGFCAVLRIHNSELADLLSESPGESDLFKDIYSKSFLYSNLIVATSVR